MSAIPLGSKLGTAFLGNLIAGMNDGPWFRATVALTTAPNKVLFITTGTDLYHVTKSYIISGLIATTSILTFVTGFAFASRACEGKTFANFSKISYFIYIALGSGVVVDLLIAGTLCYNLSQRRTGFKNLLAILNSRDKLAETLGGVSNVSGLSHLDNSDHSNFKATASNGPSLVVSINRETVEDYGMGSRKSSGYLGHAS
ncbi:hypothetical protein H0H92_012044 [Tricholoma furcatifolium]|nr:hypothetical protein H0H92_012044 [Tricholoma furcatifolium]